MWGQLAANCEVRDSCLVLAATEDPYVQINRIRAQGERRGEETINDISFG